MKAPRPVLTVMKTESGLAVEVCGNLMDIVRALHSVSHKIIDNLEDPEEAEGVALLFAHLAGSAADHVGGLHKHEEE